MRIRGLERFKTADLIEELRQRCIDKDTMIMEQAAKIDGLKSGSEKKT